LPFGDGDAVSAGVAGPAEEGAEGKYSEPVYDDGVRQMDGIEGDLGGHGDDSEADPV